MRNHLLCFLALMLFGFVASAQEKCLSHKNEMEMRAKHPHLGTVENFEAWLANKTKERKSNTTAQRGGPYKVPVIIHIIHAGEAIGNGSVNIPYGQATSQIRVLNEDFNRTNLDASSTRAIFSPKAGSLNITFELATVDPTGVPLAEPGVERINSQTRFSKSSWSTAECDATLKPQTIWDPTRYANIWVVKFSGTDDTGLFGYAQFPEGSTLPGVPAGGTATTDGCVINYRSFGSNYNADGSPVSGGPYMPTAALISAGTDRGRTLTHEIGHWLGLRHIWGDVSGCGNANSDDYCTDTPDVTGSAPLNATCATPQTRNTCTTLETDYANADVPDQIENYMDYSADICMNMFSVAQLTRVETVLINASRRKELLTSTTAAPVDPTAITSVFTKNKSEGCLPLAVTFTDASTIGTSAAAITSWTWNFDKTSIGGVSTATYSGKTPPVITFSNAGTYTIELVIGNGTKTSTSTTQVVVEGTTAPPITQGFETSISPFKAGSNGAVTTWTTTTAAKNSGTKCVWINLFDDDIRNKQVYLDIPALNLATYISGQVSFYLAYQRYDATSNTKLTLQYSTNCGTSYIDIWNKQNDALATVAGANTAPFVPTAAQWRQETIALPAGALGNSNVKLRLVLTDDYTNNIYLDDFSITASSLATPTTLTATATAYNNVNLAWTDNSGSEIGFKIERSLTTGTGFTQIGTVGANVATYTDNTTSEKTAYFYRVRAYSAVENSGYSNEATTTTPSVLATPTAFTATSSVFNVAVLNWTDNTTLETGYKIERSLTAGTGFTTLTTTAANVITYTDNTVVGNTTYYYRLSAVNATYQSNFANANVTTANEPINAPTVLTATATTANTIKLDWTDNATNEQGFKLERSSTSATTGFVVLTSPASNAITYTDTGITLGTTYYYRIRAFKDASFSVYSNTATLAISPLTAVDDELNKALNIYPNPASSNFTVQLEGLNKKGLKVLLYNNLGQFVQEKKFENGEVNFSTNSLQKGMYVLKIQTENATLHRKIVLE